MGNQEAERTREGRKIGTACRSRTHITGFGGQGPSILNEGRLNQTILPERSKWFGKLLGVPYFPGIHLAEYPSSVAPCNLAHLPSIRTIVLEAAPP